MVIWLVYVSCQLLGRRLQLAVSGALALEWRCPVAAVITEELYYEVCLPMLI